MSTSRDGGAQHAQQVQAVDLNDPSLDFLSPSFDPAKALTTPDLQPPDPEAQPLDYVAKCRVLLPPELDESLAGQQLGVGLKTGSQATREKHEQLKEKALRIEQRIRASCNVTLQGVMDYVDGNSPVAVLKKWQAAGAAVKVYTRHAAGVRGCAQGKLVAYDMFMNVILRDVVEHYTVLVKKLKDVQEVERTGYVERLVHRDFTATAIAGVGTDVADSYLQAHAAVHSLDRPVLSKSKTYGDVILQHLEPR